MNTIKKLSSNGFLIESGWVQCDKFKVLVKPLFLDLNVGDVIDNLKFKDSNGKSYVVSFDVIKKSIPNTSPLPLSSEVKSVPQMSVSASLDKAKNPQMYGQCVNLAFNSLISKEVNFDFKDNSGNYINIVLAFDLADEIYREYVKR